MRLLSGFLVSSLAVVCIGGPAQAQVQTAARPQVRILERVDDRATVTLLESRPAVVDRARILQRLAPDVRMEHMQMVLASSDEQEVALAQLLDEQQDKTSPNYRKWLTPDSFAAYFGPARADVARVTAWLQGEGFTVDKVARSQRNITFSGPVGTVEAAFHTQMHAIDANGEAHISNTTDIAIPSALAAVVRGVKGLNDFFPKSNARAAGKVTFPVYLPAGNYVEATASPLFGYSSTGQHLIAPGDAATIYNTTPLLSAGIDGTGQTIVVIARSNIALADVQIFRTLFGLKKNDPVITVAGNDPGQNPDDLEAYLDAEWAGAMSPGSTVNFVVGNSSLNSEGIDVAALYAVDNNLGDIITLSYGGCETSTGSARTAFWNTLWQQAAAQGQTVFVSSGDSGPAGCDAGGVYATGGYGSNALGSSAYNVSVGGSMFVDYGPAQYWTATSAIPYATALSYIPEAPMNQGRLSSTYLDFNSTGLAAASGIFSAGGGLSYYTARPSWQTGSGIGADPVPATGTGIPAGSPISGQHRLLPDLVSISASGHDGALVCYEEICSISSGGFLGGAGVVGGTSVAAPVMASIQALINQKNGGRQGNANYFYYKLAANQYAASTTACRAPIGTAAAPSVTLPAATCNFHDIVNGDILVPTASSGTASIGFSAATGYDVASGLGSMNVANVANNWSTVSFTATTTSLSLSPAAGIAHGATQLVTISVAPTSGGGTPTGDVSIVAEVTLPNGAFVYTLSGGKVNTTLKGLPAGSYKVHAHYAGDATFGGSDSASIPVTIAKENSAVTYTSYRGYNAGANAGQFFNTTTFSYGDETYIDTVVAGASGAGVPTGTVTYTITRNGSAIAPLVTTLDASANTHLIAGPSFPNYYIVANYPALVAGSYAITVSYSGDNNFNATSTSLAIVVNPVTPSVTYTAPAQITSGAAASFTYSITNPSTTATPNTTVAATGTVTFRDTTTSTTLGSAALSNGGATFTTNAITAAGAHTIRAQYAGDTNYAAVNTNATVTVGSLSAASTTLSSSGTLKVGSTVALTAAMNPASADGTVSFTDNGIPLGSATLSAGQATMNYAGFGVGTHALAANYSGSSSYAGSVGTLSITVSQNTPSIVVSAPLAAAYGQTVAIDAAITLSPNTGTVPLVIPTSTVSFYDGAVLLGSAAPFYEISRGTYGAVYSFTNLLPGAHTLSAVFNGDSNYAAASSGNVTLTVAKGTPIVTLASTATVYNGAAVVPLTATILLPASLAAPTASVTFFDGVTNVGTAAAAYSAAAGGYVATINASGLASGAHSFTAAYPGDANYAAASSAALSIVENTNNVWIANGNGTVSALQSSGAALTSGGVSGGGTALAVGANGYVWSVSSSGNSVTEFSTTGGVMASFNGGGITAPKALAVDGGGSVWIANGNNTISVLTSSGAAASSTAYTSVLNTPTSISVDGAGNLWVTNSGNNTVTEVIGVAAPVTTPATTAVKNNAVGVRP